MATRRTGKGWERDLDDAGRTLTLDELRALELLHICQQLQALVVRFEDAGRHLASIEGRLDRVEQYLARIDARYPQTAPPVPLAALPERRR